MSNKNTTTLYCLVLMLTVWCTWNTVKSGNLLTFVGDIKSNSDLLSREVGYTIDRIQALELKKPEVVVREVIKEVEVIIEVEVEVIKEVEKLAPQTTE